MSSSMSRLREYFLCALLISMSGWGLVVAKDAQIASANVVPANHEQVAAKAMNATYLVVLKQASLAMYDGQDSRYAPIPRQANGKMDLKSTQATAYLAYLDEVQSGFLNKAEDLLGRTLTSPSPKLIRMKHALNALPLSLSAEEAAQLEQLPEVQFVEQSRLLELATDVSPTFIGATSIWDASSLPSGWGGSYGEFKIVGIIDSGINPASPSFSAVDRYGYTHTNPFGSGIYVGLCDRSRPDFDEATGNVCNSKLIGAWDYSDSGLESGQYDGPGVEDEDGHGTHTASTAAGNFRLGTTLGLGFEISGIAPRANIIAYDTCVSAFPPATNAGCDLASTAAAVNQAVADGVDVISFSIGGGANPWTDATSVAFLAAHNAGIFVAAAAGNTSTPAPPLPGSTRHVEPWVTTVAAITHGRGSIRLAFRVTGPGTVPSEVSEVGYSVAHNHSVEFGASYVNLDFPLIISPGFLADASISDDGCAAYPADTFRRSGVRGFAVVRRGMCSFATKAQNAAIAGAAVVIFANNDATLPNQLISPVGVSSSLGAFIIGTSKIEGDALRQFVVDSSGDLETANLTRVTDLQESAKMASFSLLGPSTYSLLKPDISAPGVNVLAAKERWVQTTATAGAVDTMFNNHIGLSSGTSMATPMVAGSALLMQSLFPLLGPGEIKSLLMSTAYGTPITTPDGLQSANAFSRGSGYVFLYSAGRTGFVLDETGDRFLRANPSYTPSASRIDAGSLNLPSFQNLNCLGTCTFTRRIKNLALGENKTWTLTVEGLPTGAATVSPSNLTVGGYPAEGMITLSINANLISASQAQFGELIFTPSDFNLSVQRMPIAVKAAPAEIIVRGDDAQLVTSDNALAATVLSGATATRNITIRNNGLGMLNWSLASGQQAGLALNQYDSTASFRSTSVISNHYPTAAATSVYAAEDFDMHIEGSLSSLFVDGYVAPINTNLLSNSTVASGVTFEIYANQSNRPSGAPFWMSGTAPLWRFSASPNAVGVTVSNNDMGVNLIQAGAPALSLAQGKYWLVAYPSLAVVTSANNWYWEVTPESMRNSGLAPLRFASAPPADAWASLGDVGVYGGLSAQVQARVTCGASWISAATNSGMLSNGTESSVSFTLNSAGLSPGTHKAYLCVSSNEKDPDEGMTLVPVTLNVVTSLDPIFANSFE